MIYKIEKGKPYPLGVHKIKNGIHFALELIEKKEQGIILYYQNKEEGIKVPFLEENRCGGIFCGEILDINLKNCKYAFYQNDKILTDIAGQSFIGFKDYGVLRTKEAYQSEIREDNYDWKDDKQLHIPYEKSIIYSLHVRGFTKHPSSKVKNKGTFAGVVEKIPYLKELGITTVEISPSYDFEEMAIPKNTRMDYKAVLSENYSIDFTANNLVNTKNNGVGDETYKNNNDKEYKKDNNKDNNDKEYDKEHNKDNNKDNNNSSEKVKINYWGFKSGYYFAPKASYAASNDAVNEFKDMVKSLHENGLEIIMDFFFPREIRKGYIIEVLKFWKIEYHIDGFHIMAEDLPIDLITSEPVLVDCKILCNYFPSKLLHGQLGHYSESFQRDMRRLLKSDENMLLNFIEHIKGNQSEYHSIHTIANYSGFTLQDLVSYDHKHNEENGENNQDGSDANYSWNCGTEGKTRKKTILALRAKQVKNAFLLLLLSKGTPLLLSGDEFGNSQEGNNNPYCQDNPITWLNWSLLPKNRALFYYVKNVIELRKNHPILHHMHDSNYSDRVRNEYPEVSYHGEEAWKPIFTRTSRQLGVMYSGDYAKNSNNQSKDEYDNSFYIAYNLHWEAQYFALPKLSNNQSWYLVIDSSAPEGNLLDLKMIKQTEIKVIVDSRTIQVFIGK